MKSIAAYFVLLFCQLCVEYCVADWSKVHPYECTCSDKSQCNPVNTWSDASKEVVIITNHTTDYKQWVWKSITAVVSISDTLNEDLMCFAHSKGAKYGIKKEIVADYNYTSQAVDNFIQDVEEELTLTNSDILMLDLMPLVGNCNNAKEHVDPIINVTTRVIKEIKEPGKIKVICVVPWKPPCYDSECFIGPALARVCDAIEVNPDSFISFCDDACIARATVPLNRMRMGLMEYEVIGFKQSQIMIGMPWHGYNYTCDRTFALNNTYGRRICFLKKETDATSGISRCAYESSRVRIPIETFYEDHPAQLVLSANNYEAVDQAPYLVTQGTVKVGNETVTTTYMGWFENIASLHAKYELVHDNNFRGIVVYTGDDLTYTNVRGETESLDDRMWAWVYHTILSTGKVSYSNDEPDYAAIVAGVGVSMFVFGCLLGVIFACVFFRRNKKLKAPFHRDTSNFDDYRDDHDEDL